MRIYYLPSFSFFSVHISNKKNSHHALPLSFEVVVLCIVGKMKEKESRENEINFVMLYLRRIE